MKRLWAMLVTTMVCLGPFAQVGAYLADDGSRGPAPLDAGDDWYDALDDLSHVYVPTGGLVGVEVAGGEARLKAGYDEGWIASSIITCPEGHRYDLVLLEAVTPGDSHVNVTVLDASSPPTSTAFANATVPLYVNITGTDVSLFGVDIGTYPSIRIQVTLVADGTDRPRLLAWTVRFIPLGEWQDDFLGAGKMAGHAGVNITAGEVSLDFSSSGSGPTYDPYPPAVFTDSRGDVDVFYPTAVNDGYQNDATISSTSMTQGLDSGDLDKDGYLDLVLARDGQSGSMILWGSSSGKWSTSDATKLAHTDSANDAAIGDFNGDGWPDIAMSAVGGMVADGSYVWLNNGDGTFDNAPDIKLSGQTSTVDAGDLNNDGYDDIVMTHGTFMSGPCYYGGSNGPDTTKDLEFFTGVTMTGVTETLITDVDQDGYLDLLFAMQINREAPVYLGSASGIDTTIDYKLELKGLPQDVSVGDVDGDGYLDIGYITGDNTGAASLVEIFKGSASGWSKDDKHEFKPGAVAYQIELVDVDVDGYEDILIAFAQDFKIYYGDTTWPTTPDVTKTGLAVPQDMTVAVPESQGGKFGGTVITEEIPIDEGMKWDVLYLEADVPEETRVTISVLDDGFDVIDGFDRLEGPDVDLSGLGDRDAIHVGLTLASTNTSVTPALERLLVNWMPWNVWRDQFYGEVKAESLLGIGENNLRLGDTSDRAEMMVDLLSANLRSAFAYDVPSTAFLRNDLGGWKDGGTVTFDTRSAHAVDGFENGGDGLQDLVFASYADNQWDYDTESPLFAYSPAGWYDTPVHTFDTTGAMDVLFDDLNGDGHGDVVFAQERDDTGYNVRSVLFWGKADGWNETPDVEFDTKAATGVAAADFDGDDRLDLVFSCFMDTDHETDSLVFLQEAAGFCGTVPSSRLPTVGANDVDTGDINGDGWQDAVFANSFDGITYALDSYVYWNDQSGGFTTTPLRLPTLGATGVLAVDIDWDYDVDLVFANNRNASSGYSSESYIYLHKLPGGPVGPSPDVRLATEGAYAVAAFGGIDIGAWGDLVFACQGNESGYNVPSVEFKAPSVSGPPSYLFPTVGASDVMPVILSHPNRGGYVSRPITPDPGDDIGTFHTLRYEAALPTPVQGTIAILDAVTGEVLAETTLASGPQEWDLRGLFSYRDHPSVRVSISVEGLIGTTAFSLDDLWLNWSKRTHLAPQVLGTSLTNTTVYRGNTVHLLVDTSDEYDTPDLLTIEAEHQLAGEDEWDTGILGATSFEDGLWKVEVAPATDDPFGDYMFRVNVTDRDGLFSGFVKVEETLRVLPNLLTMPILYNVTASDSLVTIKWREPIDVGDLSPLGYRILRGPTAMDLAEIMSMGPLDRMYEDENVTNGVTYHYAVQAFNDLGDSPLSEVLNATPVGLPGTPLDLVAEAGDGQVSVSWGPPLSDGGSAILGYHVYRSEEGGAIHRVGSPEGPAYLDTEVTNGVEYTYRVSAFSLVGEGLTGEPASARPLGLAEAPGGLTLEVGTMALTVSWEVPLETGGGAITGYSIYKGTDPDGLAWHEGLPASLTSYFDEDVVVGTTYHYAVAAITEAGEGALSPTVSGVPVDLPGTPTDVRATAGDAMVVLNWSAPDYDGASPITGYVVLRGTSPTGLGPVANLGVVLSFTDESVTNGRIYYYAVAAVNGVGRGVESDPVEARPDVLPTAPGAPRIISVEVSGPDDNDVVIRWAAPSEDGGSPVTAYLVLRGGSVDDLKVVATLGSVTTWTDEGLEHGRTYYYAVVAVNAIGEGLASNTQKVDVPERESGAGSMGLIALVVLVLVVVAVLGLLLMRRRAGMAPEEATPYEEPSEWDGEDGEAEIEDR